MQTVGRNITKLVITGGPCAGKTTAMLRIREEFEKEGYSVVIVPETATELICSGITPWTMDSKVNYQMHQLMLQLEKERIYALASTYLEGNRRILIFFDRGAMDNKAYLADEEFAHILEKLSLSEEDILKRYDAVFHLVSAAKGDGKAYSLASNNARTESAELAARIDDRLLEVWKAHPRRRIIDTGIDFNKKLDDLITEIKVYLETSQY